jgi:hypothetical protein
MRDFGTVTQRDRAHKNPHKAKLTRFSDQLPIDWDAVQRVPHGQMG